MMQAPENKMVGSARKTEAQRMLRESGGFFVDDVLGPKEADEGVSHMGILSQAVEESPITRLARQIRQESGK